jgi:hypothetical protein
MASPPPWAQIADLIDQDEKNALPTPTYPTYARIFRSLRANVPVRWIIVHAGDSDFVDRLQREYSRDRAG